MQLDPRLNFVEIAQNTWCDYSTHNNRKLNAVLVINDEGTNFMSYETWSHNPGVVKYHAGTSTTIISTTAFSAKEFTAAIHAHMWRER